MNIWAKSILIGVFSSAIVYLLTLYIFSPGKSTLYKAEYTLRIEPTGRKSMQTILPEAAEVLNKRIKATFRKYSIEEIDSNTLFIQVKNVNDTLLSRNLMTTNGRIQFRELYSLNELMPMFQSANKVTEKLFSQPVDKSIDSTIHDSLSAEVRDLLEKMKSFEEKNIFEPTGIGSLIEFISSNPENGCSIGKVLVKDTAMVGKIIRTDEVLRSAPPDIRYYFGPEVPDIMLGETINSESLLLFFVRTEGSERAILENEDIYTAKVDVNSYSKQPEVNLQFKEYGSQIWLDMTKKNIEKCIAIVFDNYVVSAPKVLSAIYGGKSSINGNFSFLEAETLASILKAKPLSSARLQVIGSKIEKESPGGRFNTVLILLLSFAIFSSLSFILYKHQKAKKTGRFLT